MKSYKPEFLIDGTWYDNAIRFATREEAERNARDRLTDAGLEELLPEPTHEDTSCTCMHCGEASDQDYAGAYELDSADSPACEGCAARILEDHGREATRGHWGSL